MRLQRLFASAVLALACAACVGCGDSRFKPVYPVRGQVLYEGKPAAGASVTFHAVSNVEDPWTKPSAEVDEDGNFVVNTYKAGDGAPAGSYEVTVIWLPKGYTGPLEKANK